MTAQSIASQDYVCDWCGEIIPMGSTYIIRCYELDKLKFWNFHPNCTFKGGYIAKSMLDREDDNAD